MTQVHELIIRRIVFWLTIAGATVGSGLAWWYVVMVKLDQATAPELIITGIDRGETVLFLLALFSSCVPISMCAAGQPLKRAEVERSFRINMHDIAHAYAIAHSADRSGVFTLSSEFDSVRERMDVLMQHPDLHELSPELRVVAAQMSQISRDLALRYNDQAITDAYDLIAQCERDCEQLEELVSKGIEAENAIRIDARGLDIRSATAYSQLQAIEEAIERELQPLGLELNRNVAANVVLLKQNQSE